MDSEAKQRKSDRIEEAELGQAARVSKTAHKRMRVVIEYLGAKFFAWQTSKDGRPVVELDLPDGAVVKFEKQERRT